MKSQSVKESQVMGPPSEGSWGCDTPYFGNGCVCVCVATLNDGCGVAKGLGPFWRHRFDVILRHL